MAESRTIGVFGAGWVGLVTGGCFAELGHDVIVRDVVPDRIAGLQAGRMPFHEPDLPDVLARNRERIRYTLDAADLTEADALFVCVQTPPTYSGDADLSFVWSALDDLPRVDRRQVLVMKSTVPVGTGEKVRAALEARGLTNIGYVSNPEFLAEGHAVRDFLDPDRIVIGAFAEAARDPEAAEAPRPAAREGGRAPRARVQGGNRRHARSAVARPGVAAAGRGRGGTCVGPRRAARRADEGRGALRHRPRGRDGRRRGRDRHGVG